MIEFLTNIYILPIISVIIGLLIIWFYDKFEKKQYVTSQYVRFGIVIYVSSLFLMWIITNNIFIQFTGINKLNANTSATAQAGGGTNIQYQYNNSTKLAASTPTQSASTSSASTSDFDIPASHIEHFTTGLPMF